MYVAHFISIENCRKHCKEAIKARVTDVQITWVSNYKKFKLDTCRHPHDPTPITWQITKTNQDQEFCYRYYYYYYYYLLLLLLLLFYYYYY